MRICFPYTDRRIRLEPQAVKVASVRLLEQDHSCYDSSIGDVLYSLTTVGPAVGPGDLAHPADARFREHRRAIAQRFLRFSVAPC